MIQPKRRGFLLGLGALLAAPAIAKADSLMPISSRILTPKLWGDGIHDDTYALQVLLDRLAKTDAIVVPPGQYLITKTLDFPAAPHANVIVDTVTLTAGAPMDLMMKLNDARHVRVVNSRFIGGSFSHRLRLEKFYSPTLGAVL